MGLLVSEMGALMQIKWPWQSGKGADQLLVMSGGFLEGLHMQQFMARFNLSAMLRKNLVITAQEVWFGYIILL